MTGQPLGEPTDPRIGSIIEGRYRIVRRLGRGGTAEVFEAEHLGLKRRVAVKVLLPPCPQESVSRMLSEARLLASLHHPNICDIFDVGIDERLGPYLVLERLFGESLLDYRRTMTRVPAWDAVDMTCQVLSGLHAAHTVDIVHRDLTPSNVFLVERIGCAPVVKLLDFGFARVASEGKRITTPGFTCGTPRYMSPEQLRGDPIDRRADLFAVGVLFYEMLLGANPFAEAFEGSRPLPSDQHDVPVAFDDIVRRALAPDPRDRFESALEMQDALRAALEDMPTHSSRGRSYSGVGFTANDEAIETPRLVVGVIR